MQVVIEFDEKRYQDILKRYAKRRTPQESKTDAITIPKGATNGDVIKAMFPNMEEPNFYGMKEYMYDPNWWNAPYK